MHESSSAYVREHERRSVLVEAQITEGGQWHDCRIVNISVGGARLLIGCQFRQGDPVRLRIGSFGQFGGVVAWQNREGLGVKFTHDPFEMADVVMGLAMYG